MLIDSINYSEVKPKLGALAARGQGIVILGIDSLLRGEYSPALEGNMQQVADMIIRALETAEVVPRFTSSDQIFEELYTFELPSGRTDLIILFTENAPINFNLLNAWRTALTGISTLTDWDPNYRGI